MSLQDKFAKYKKENLIVEPGRAKESLEIELTDICAEIYPTTNNTYVESDETGVTVTYTENECEMFFHEEFYKEKDGTEAILFETGIFVGGEAKYCDEVILDPNNDQERKKIAIACAKSCFDHFVQITATITATE